MVSFCPTSTNDYVVEHIRAGRRLYYGSFYTFEAALTHFNFLQREIMSRRGPYRPEAVTLRERGTLMLAFDRKGNA